METPLQIREQVLGIQSGKIHAHLHVVAQHNLKRAPVESVAAGHARSLHVCLGIPVHCALTNIVVNCC